MGDTWFGGNLWFGSGRMAVADVSEDKENPRKALRKYIRGDRNLSLQRLLFRGSEEKSTVDVSDKEILHDICSHRAELCLGVMIHDVLHSWNINDALEPELYPLHIAAQSLWFYGTDTILNIRDARADLPPDQPTKSPLTFALKSIRDNTCATDWNPKMSIFNLIYIFCLPQMKEPLETVALLASKTEQLEAISRHCVLQGETVQFAALLLVAWDKLVKPVSDQGIKGSPIGQLILSELQRYQENCVSENPDNSAEFHDYGANLGNAWKLLDILDIARDTIHECRQAKDLQPHDVPFYVASKLCSRHNIYLEHEDKYANDVKCLRPQLTPKQKAWLFRMIDKKIHSMSTLPKWATSSERRGAERVGSSLFCNSVAPNMNFRQGTNTVGSLHSFHTVAPKMKLRRNAERVGSSHSFHTFVPNMNAVKPVTSRLSQVSQNPGTFPSGISSSIPRLLSALKRI